MTLAHDDSEPRTDDVRPGDGQLPLHHAPLQHAPLHHAARLQEIADLDLLSPEVDAELEDMARAAATYCELPVAMVSVILDDAQFIAAMHGVQGWVKDARGHPAEWSFCRTAVETRAPFVVADATLHPITTSNPMVTLEGVRCYAGIPLITSKGHAIGTFCVAGGTPRDFSDDDLDVLRRLARSAMTRIEARRSA